MFRIFISFYITLLGCLLGGIYFLEKFQEVTYQKEFQEDLSKDYQGLFILMEELFPYLTEKQWQQLLNKISLQSNVPLISKSRNQWQLSPIIYSHINDGETYVDNYDEQIIYKMINEDVIVRVGPMLTTKTVEELYVYYYIILLISFALVVLCWAGWQHYKNRRLAQAAHQFSEGNLNARSPTGFLGIPTLSLAFNTMATRIERLFQSHRNLTNAVSHELRSPIAKMRFQLALLDSSPSDDEYNQLLLGISDDLDDMDNLVEEILTHAKMERAEPIVDLQHFNLSEWLEDELLNLEPDIKTSLIKSTASELNLLATFDTKLMARLLRNLVYNADRFSKTRIEVGVAKSNGFFQLWVDDNGEGIPIPQRKRLLEPFTRMDNSRNRESGGYGLGLSIATHIARCHAGTLEINDAPLGGARLLTQWPVSNDHL